jgi:RNA polymerase sigma-70 factor (ECF subfamily)
MSADDEAAFTEVYHHYWKLLFSVAANKLGNLADAEEVVQDVFADLWRRRADIQIDHSLKSFLAAAARNQVFSRMARRHRELLGTSEWLHTQDHPSLSAEQPLQVKELHDQVAGLAATLPERCRLVYKLSREEGLSNKKIAVSLNISEKTVESQITKALRIIRTGLHFLWSGILVFIHLF